MSYKKFVKMWVQNKSNEQIARAFDHTPQWVSQTANKLRKGGGQFAYAELYSS